jgi:type I restriction enzyme S subunit
MTTSKSWRATTLGDECEIVSGSTPKTSDRSYWDGDIPWLTPADLSKWDGVYIDGGARYITKAGLDSCSARLFPRNTVLMSSRAPIGYTAIAAREMCTNQGFKSMLPSSTIHPEWLRYYIEYALPEIKAMSSGTTFAEISGKKLGTLPLLLPPVEEQKRIVEALDRILVSIEAANDELIDTEHKAGLLRLSILNHYLTKDSGSEAGSSDHWKTMHLSDAATVTMGQSPPGSTYNKAGQGTPFFQGKTEFGDKHPTVRQWTTAGRKFAEPGDILMSVRAPVGPTNIADCHCAIGRGLASIRAQDFVDQQYLILVLKNIEASIQARGKGTTFEAISGEELRNTEVHLPPVETQRIIVQRVSASLDNLKEVIEKLNSERRSLVQLRRSVLHKAFTGQLLKDN